MSGPIRGLGCVRWIESSDPHTWSDNYLCGARVTPPPTRSPTPSPTRSPTPSPTVEGSYEDIIGWLNRLIEEGKDEIRDIAQVGDGLKSVLLKAENVLREARKAEAIALNVLKAAAKKKAEAEGAWKACQKKYASEKDRLDGEIAIFVKVNDILSGLKNGKQLVEKEKADVKAFISLADQADPAKVQAIMDLVSHLIRVNKAELVRIKKDLDECRQRLSVAIEEHDNAYGKWKAAVKYTAECLKLFLK